MEVQDRKKRDRDAEIANEICREFEELAKDRYNFESQWQEIAERVDVNSSNLFLSRGSLRTKGEKRTEHMFDSTGAVALSRFSAILDSLLTPRNQTWHRLTTNIPELNKDREVKLYFDAVNQALFRYRYGPKANFASQNQMDYRNLGGYGTAGLFIDKLWAEPGIRYKSCPLNELYLAENHQGMVDKVLRHFVLTARQAIQKWGNKVPDSIKNAAKVSPEREFFFIHCVKPRQDLDPTKKDYRGMDFASYYVSMEGKALLDEGGYSVFPYAVSRYEQSSGEVYGRSPAMEVLPALKTLNEQKKTVLKQGHRTVDPILLMHDDGILDGFSLKPGATNAGAVTADGRPLVHTLPVGNIAIGKDLMDDERIVIKDALLVSIFQILQESPQMTATEVLERTREKGLLLAPTLGRQQSERLGSMIDREIDVLAMQGLIPPMPRALIQARGEYRVEYDSPLSKAQRAEEASGLMRTVEMALNTVNITGNPEPLDHFNWDVIIPEMADIQGVPAKWMRSQKEIEAMRESRSQQAETQEMIQGAPAAAAMIKAINGKGTGQAA